MSRTTMLLLDLEKKEVIDAVEYKNSWGSAPYVWDKMSTRYLHWDSWLRPDCGPLWRLFDDKRIADYQRAVLGMTFDRAIITHENYQRAAKDIREFLKAFPPEINSVNHWGEIADYIDALPEENTAVGFWMTSVSENPFMKWDEENETENLRDDLYNLYEELEK